MPALTAGDRDLAETLFAELASEKPLDEPCRILPLGSPELGSNDARYVRLLDTDPERPYDFRRPPEGVARDFTSRLHRGRKLLKQAVPELAAEQEAIINEIILAVGSEDTKGYTFDGASSYMLWGALLLNVVSPKSDVAMIEVLAHEAGHSLLFGLCTEEPLVNNPDAELYDSPLRQDPRPMDGIYHATFVSARMHWTMSRLLESELFTPDQKAEAERRRDASWDDFQRGYETVAAHANLTATGETIMHATRHYMDRLFAPIA